jgi:hypothetical protein
MYQILTANSVLALETKVQAAYQKGFVPQGGPVLVTITPLLIAQAVVYAGFTAEPVTDSAS